MFNVEGQKHLTADLPVDVGGSDVDGLDVSLDAASTVDVVFHGVAENHLDGTGLFASLRNAVPSLVNQGAQRNADGSFHFQGISPGRYRLTAQTPKELCVESIKMGDRDVSSTAFDIASGAALRADVTLSKQCGSIEMRAVFQGEAVPGAKVVLLLDGTPKDPGGLREDFVDDEGLYSFTGLTPGRYLLWSWTMRGKGAGAGPSSLAAVEQQATVVEVKAGEPVHVDVTLLPEEGKVP
jgi:hypothetical protein